MNPLDITRAAIGNTFRSKTRTALTVTAIVIGAFTLTITSAIGTPTLRRPKWHPWPDHQSVPLQ